MTKRGAQPPAVVRGDFHRLKVALVSEIELFGDLPEGEIDRLLGRSTMTQLPKGHTLVSDELSDVLFILKKGRVQLYRLSPEGKKFVIETLRPGSVFGECVLTGQRLSGLFIEAVEESVVCVLHRDDLERLIASTPQLAIRLLEILGRRIYELEARLEDLAFKKVPARVAALLVRLAHREGNPIVGYTHQDLADMVGAYRETVTQAINQLKQAGIIAVGRKQIEILDFDRLQAVAESD